MNEQHYTCTRMFAALHEPRAPPDYYIAADCMTFVLHIFAQRSMDPSSCSNFSEVKVDQIHWKLNVDFKTKQLHCCVDLRGKTLKDGCSKLVRDSLNL